MAGHAGSAPSLPNTGRPALVARMEAADSSEDAVAPSSRPGAGWARGRRVHALPWIEAANGVTASLAFALAYVGTTMPLLVAGLHGLAAYLGFRLAFGTDAAVEDVYSGVEGFTAADAARAIAEARTALDRAAAAGRALAGSGQEAALARLVAGSDRVLAAVEEEPRRLPRAQRYLDGWVLGLADASEKYARLRAHGGSDAIRAEFSAYLADGLAACDRQERSLVERDEAELSIDMEAQRRRLAPPAGR